LKRRSSARALLKHERNLSRAGYSPVAGVDEAGRGPLAGPVVAAAVILKKFDFSARVDDSKKLSAGQREKAYREIVKKSVFGVGVVDEKTIDLINIYQATKRAMQLALSNLGERPAYVIVDGNVRIPTRCPIKCIPRGDSNSLSIAAASIIAKVTRDNIMLEYDRIYPQYGFARHKGYGTKSHMKAIKKHGPSPIHRMSFHPINSV
jgi:ribonuclease HII